MSNMEITNCNQCPNQCPKDALKCGRGRRYFEQLNGADEGNGRNREGGHGQPEDSWEQKRRSVMFKRYEAFDPDNKLIRNFWDISHTMHHISEGKGSQKRILMVLKENGSTTQRELTEYLGIQPGSASEVIGKLEAAGLILRTPSRTDRRTVDICLTEAGEAAAGEAYEQRRKRHEKMFACLSEEEKQTLLGLLEKINESWNCLYRENDGMHMAINGKKGRRHHCRK